jgi:hypothetical protein
MTGLENPQILELSCEDIAGNTTVVAITLQPPDPFAEAPTAGTERVPVAPTAARDSQTSEADTSDKQVASVSSAETVTCKPFPQLIVDAPAGKTYFRASIPVEGRVVNGDSLSWKIGGTLLSDTLAVSENGAFAFQISSADLHGTHVLRISADGTGGSTEEQTFILLDGNVNPTVSITSPRREQHYGSRVRVSGVIVDPYADDPTFGGIESVTYDVTSAEVFALAESVPKGEIDLTQDNTFDFVVNTRGLTGPQDINILVCARNGNRTRTSVRVLEGEADIPVFSVLASDQSALVRWDPVPSATGYTLSYRSANPGQRPGREYNVERVRSPYVLTGLENGNRYVFRLRAGLPGEADVQSAERWAIPLSPETLKPVAAGEFGQIRISWPSIAGSEGYVLWRSAGGGDEYTRIGAIMSDTHYLDKDVRYGLSYLYRVSLASVPELYSATVRGESAAFAAEKLKFAGICRMGRCEGINLYGGYAFLAGGEEGISIVDITFPENPTIVGALRTNAARDVVIGGEYAFVADGDRGLKVVDITDPRHPVEVGMRKTMDARAIAVDGKRAFVADGSSGVKIIDVSSPVQPSRVGSLATEDACQLAIHAGILYLADGTGGLRIFGLTDSTELQEKCHLTGIDVLSLCLEGSLLYLAAGDAGLIILDVSDPTEPVELGRYAAKILDVDVSGTLAYLADGRDQLTVVDVSDPAHPRQFASYRARGASSVVVRDHYAYLGTASGLEVVHILIQGRSVPVASAYTGGKAYSLTISGTLAYTACHDRGVRVVDISDPAVLCDGSVIGSWSAGYAMGIEVAGSVAFVANGKRGLSVLDLTALQDDDVMTQPEQIGSYYTGGTAHGSRFRSGLLVVADGPEGLKVLDVTEVSNPVEIGSVAVEDARDIALIPGYVLVADANRGLIVCDLTDPSAPVLREILGSEGVFRVEVQDTLVAAAGRNGVDLYDFSDPQNPRSRGGFHSRFVEGICIHGPYLYIAEGHLGLRVLDIRSPGRPVQVSGCPDIYAVDVAVRDGYALVADSRKIHAVEILIPLWLRRE